MGKLAHASPQAISLPPFLLDFLRYLAGRPGHYVPVSELLDDLRAQGRGARLKPSAVWRLECRYVADKLMDRLASANQS